MKILDVWKQGDDVRAYCNGDGIDANFSCKEISINGKTYIVADYDILRSLSGSIAAVLRIDCVDVQDVPCSSFYIVR